MDHNYMVLGSSNDVQLFSNLLMAVRIARLVSLEYRVDEDIDIFIMYTSNR